MRWFYKLPLRFRSLFRKGRVEQEGTPEEIYAARLPERALRRVPRGG